MHICLVTFYITRPWKWFIHWLLIWACHPENMGCCWIRPSLSAAKRLCIQGHYRCYINAVLFILSNKSNPHWWRGDKGDKILIVDFTVYVVSTSLYFTPTQPTSGDKNESFRQSQFSQLENIFWHISSAPVTTATMAKLHHLSSSSMKS